MFEDHLLTIDFHAANEHASIKAALLRASIWVDDYKIYSSLVTDAKEASNDAVDHIAAHFEHKANLIFERAVSTRHIQSSRESNTQFVAELRQCASKCDFAADQPEKRVRGQFVAWLYDIKMCKRLLQKDDASTLQYMV